MFINFTPFPNDQCISRTPPSFCWSITWPPSTSSKAQAFHKFTEFPLFHWWPPNLWAIVQDNFTDLVTNNNFHFHDPFIGSFNHSYFLFQTVSKNNTPFSALLPTLHHNLYLLPITFFSSQFLQAANINTTSLQSHSNFISFPRQWTNISWGKLDSDLCNLSFSCHQNTSALKSSSRIWCIISGVSRS